MAPVRTKSEGRRRIGHILLWGSIVVVVSPLILFLAWRGWVSIDINRLRQKSIDRGEPQTIAEIVGRLPQISDKDNVAVALLDIWETDTNGLGLVAWRTGGVFKVSNNKLRINPRVPFRGETTNTALPWPEAEQVAARDFVEKRQDRKQRTMAALERPDVRYPPHYGNGLERTIPYLAWVKSETASFKVESFLYIQEGRVTEAINTIELMAGMTDTLRGDPLLIGQLVRVACTLMTLQCVHELLSWHPLDNEQLDRLATITTRLEFVDALQRSLIAERTAGLSLFSMSTTELNTVVPGWFDNEWTSAETFWNLIKLSGYPSTDRRMMMRAFDRALGLGTNMTTVSYEKASRIFAETKTAGRRFPPKIFTIMWMPALTKVPEKFLRVESERRLTLFAIAIEMYRLDNKGAYPPDRGTMKESPRLARLLQPFDGETFILSVLPTGFKINPAAENIPMEPLKPFESQKGISINIIHHYESSEKQ